MGFHLIPTLIGMYRISSTSLQLLIKQAMALQHRNALHINTLEYFIFDYTYIPRGRRGAVGQPVTVNVNTTVVDSIPIRGNDLFNIFIS